MEGLSLIDVSAEDDLLFDLATPPPAPVQAPPRHPDPTHAGSLVGAEATSYLNPAGGSAVAAGRAADPDGVMEEQAAPERAESPKQRKAKTGVNLRKSLAWDSAFFTSEGVLDTEELAIVNSTFRKTQGSRLPGIIEDMRKSGESTTSTLESESWTMESLETELFDNVRASIQRSLGKPNKVPGEPAGSSKPPKVTANVPRTTARKGVDRIPQTKIRAPVSTSQGVGGAKQRPQVNSKEPAAARVVCPVPVIGNVWYILPFEIDRNSFSYLLFLLEKNLPGAAEAKTSSKPPRALPRVAMMRSSTNTAITSATSDKRSSTGGVVNKQAAGKTANTSVIMRPGGGTKSSSISKSSAFTSAATSSHDVLMHKTEAKTKPTLINKNRTAQRVPVRSSSKSDISKTIPSRSSGNKFPARGHADRASPSISPCSSVDSMSSVISGASTASTVGKMSHTSESLNTLSPSLRKSNDCPLTPKLRSPIVTDSLGTAACGDKSKATSGITNQGKGFKPTGLRRPTPKIGYFDAEKSIDQNIGAQVQLQPVKIQCVLPPTPKSQPPTQNMNAASSTFGQQEPKLNAVPHKSNDPSKSEPVTKPEACTLQIDPVLSKPEADNSIDQNVGAHVQLQSMKIHCLLPATLYSTFVEQESKHIEGPHYGASASKSKAMPLKDAQMEVQPSKVAEPEVCMHLSSPVMAKSESEKSIDQNVGAPVQPPLLEIQCLHPATPTSQASSTFCQQEAKPVAAPRQEISTCKSKATKVTEPEACLHQPDPVVAADTLKENIPAAHQNIQANVDASSLIDMLTQKLSSISLREATPDLAS
ncbi:hypothetical protein BAE44_0004430 [Dichanthelium oligosanthes]|uniref:Uncharacterized protein n=1 Tax=Dichanthelium oligosanthes TaxID=888268 RepID=A0A1E5WAY2_9POAL|nr:hypothetical protein BAE44_0004430 [Dichanthelium oligosanthes]